jgi:hypothetical protein
MKKLLVTFLLTILSFITYSQSGVGYLNYTVYNIISNGAGQYANNATDFVNMFDVTKGATVYASGVSTAQKTLYFQNGWTPSGVPNGGAYTGIKVTGYFIPKETGVYSFGIDGDDGVDFLLDGNVITSFYGAHGFAGYRYGTVSLVAGKSYTFMARYENWGGGWGMYLVWKRPSQTTWSIQSDEVTSLAPAVPTKKAVANFNFNTNITSTTFSVGSALSSAGSIDITTLLDSVKITNGYNAAIIVGQAEWSYVNILNGVTTLYIDIRQFGTTLPSSINSVSILDTYSGPITFLTNDGTWAQYIVPSTLPKVTNGTSTYNSNIRNAGYNNYAFTCNIAFSSNMVYKPQSITLTTTNNLSQIYTNIVTISDVYLAFKELSNKGILGNQNGNEFTYGIQYQNADIDGNGLFNEADCFLLLQSMTGAKTLVDTFNLNKTIRLIPQKKYDSIGKSNWNTFTNPLNSTYSFDINTGKSTDTINIAVTWKGDVNLSHSTTAATNNLTSMALRSMNVSNEINGTIMTEIINDTVYATLTIDPLQQELVGTQFKLNYDNSLLKFDNISFKTKSFPTNFGTDKIDYINFGSLLTDGTTLDNTTQYKIVFTTKSKLDNILGLVSVYLTDAVNKEGTPLKLRIQ